MQETAYRLRILRLKVTSTHSSSTERVVQYVDVGIHYEMYCVMKAIYNGDSVAVTRLFGPDGVSLT